MALNTAKKQKDSIRKDIEVGLLESQLSSVDEMTEEELAEWELANEMYLLERDEKEALLKLEAESPLILEEGLKKVEELLFSAKGELVGAVNKSRFYDFFTTELVTIGEDFGKSIEKEDVLNLLAQKNQNYTSHFDNSLVWAGRNSGDGSNWRCVLGKEVIAKKHYSKNSDFAYSYFIFGKSVTAETFNVFINEVEAKVKIFDASLSPEEEAMVLQKKLELEIEVAFKKAKLVEPGICGFDHLYGGQSFGSGGAHGNVKAFDLEAFRNGKKIEKKITMLRGDNQFISGVYAVEIEPNTIVIAEGGDAIGREGRNWMEVFVCE